MKRFLFALLLAFCIFSATSSFAEIRTMQILYTSDEHGWIQRNGTQGGAAELYQKWLIEDSIKTIPTLILSGGDNNTGPAISSITKGKATVEIMNAMGYYCSAVGNHEFDFGQDNFNEMCKIKLFPYLSANVKLLNNCKVKKENIQDCLDTTINGINIFIVGLTTFSLPQITISSNIKNMRVLNYLESLMPYKERIKKADVAILLAHACIDELQELQNSISDWGFDIISGAHCHASETNYLNNLPYIQGDAYLHGYHRIVLHYDTQNESIRYSRIEHKLNDYTEKNPEITSIIDKWFNSTNKSLLEPIGYAASDIPVDSPQLVNLLLYSWFKEIPSAYVALMNRKGIRQGFVQGDITVASLIGMLPFDNELYIVKMTGKSIKMIIEKNNPYVAGVNVNDNYKLDNGEILDDAKSYQVLVNNFIYAGGDNFPIKENSVLLKETGINIRTPLEKVIRSYHSSWNHPINQFLDDKIRFSN